MKLKIKGLKKKFALLPHRCSTCDSGIWLEFYYRNGTLEQWLGNYGPFRNDIHCSQCHDEAERDFETGCWCRGY